MAGLLFTFPDGNIEADYITTSFSQSDVLYNKLKPVDNSVKLSAVYSTDLANHIKNYAESDVKVVVYSDNVVIFTGYLRKNFTFTKTQRNQPIALEIVSPSFLLDVDTTAAVFKTGKTLGEIVNELGTQAGFTLNCTLTETVTFFRIEKDVNIYDTLQKLLFEFGYVFDFDRNGNFIVNELFKDVTSDKFAFTGENCLNEIQIKRTEKDYTGVSATWTKKSYVTDSVLYEDTQGATSSEACSIEVAPGSHMYEPDNTTSDVYLEYDSTAGEIIWATSAELVATGTYIDNLTKSIVNYGTKALINIYNSSSSITATFHKFQIKGNAWVESSENTNKTSVVGSKADEISLDYLNSSSDVNTFIQKLANYYRYSVYSVTIQSKEDVAVGSFVTVTDDGIGTITGRIISKTTSYTEVYNYTVESVTSYEAATISDSETTVKKSASNGFISSAVDTFSSLYANHVVTLYKASETPLTDTGIGSSATYKFSNNTFTWDDATQSNGWTTTKPTTSYTVYMITATAYGQSETATINANDWSLPIAFGVNGTNTRTIQLFRRADAKPEDLPFAFTQSFASREINATTAQLNGWVTDYPAIDEESNPLWEIHVTIISTETTYTITPVMWSTPAKISQDVEVTQSQIQEMINSAQRLAAPIVYADTTFGGIAVDDNNVCLATQSISTTVHVMQTNEELEFQWGTFNLPEGCTAYYSGNKLTLTFAQGTTVKSGSINIPILYYPYLSMDQYVDEEEEAYTDENGASYGYWEKSETATTYNLGFGYSAVRGGRYLNTALSVDFISLEDIPSGSNVIIADYFTWMGEDTDSDICEDGTFLKGACYKWNGSKWEKDSAPAHLQTALSDILADAETDLENNNSDVVGLFKKIVASQAIVENLIVTGNALINRLQALNIYADTFTSYDKKSQGYADNSLTELGLEVDTDHTIIEGSHITTGLIDADNLKVGSNDETLSDVLDGKANYDDIPDVANKIDKYHKIYCQIKKSDYSAVPTAPTSYITDTVVVGNYTWYLTKPTAQDGYYIFSCVQTVTVDGLTVSNTTPDIDTDTIIDTANGYIRTDLINAKKIVIEDLGGYDDLEDDIDSAASTAQSNAINTAAADATTKANAAQTNAISTASTDATTKANNARTNAANDVYAATKLDTLTDKTIISGGRLKTGLVDAAYVKAIEGVFTDITVSGTVYANSGYFKGVVGETVQVISGGSAGTSTATGYFTLSSAKYDIFIYGTYGTYNTRLNYAQFTCNITTNRIGAYDVDINCNYCDESIKIFDASDSSSGKIGITVLSGFNTNIYAQYFKRG